ncbi:hypothetical protein NXS98_09505 [Fontisphaera persica]|uniref:hypothetical protein n=1 Tax=Fontisphaera persica TaxID=2974023 RepID=UPI0024C02612|nr:hypothetical protein [Fontisphaera persica]WCJ57963.1 hypothetical protein NXS98_09505 [Fontisphaera persica]
MARQQPKQRSVSVKALIILVLLVLLGAGVAWWVDDVLHGPPRPWYARYQIKRYLKEQTGQSKFETKFNLNLAQEVAKLEARLAEMDSALRDYETNANRLRAEIQQINRALTTLAELNRRKGVLSNRVQDLEMTLRRVPPALTNLPAGVLTNLAAMQTELAALAAVVDPVVKPLQPLRDEINALEKQVDEKTRAQAPLRRELAQLQQEVKDGKRMQGTNEVALTAEDVTAANNRMAEIQNSLNVIAAELKPVEEQLAQKQAEYDKQIAPVAGAYRTLRWLQQRVNSVGLLETNVQRLRLDITTGEQDLAGRLSALNLAPDMEALRKALADRQAAVAELDKKYQQQITDRAALRKDLLAQKNLLAAQQADLSAQFRQRLNVAKTYREMYVIMGEMLTVVEDLMSRADTNQQRVGLQMAMQAGVLCSTPNLVENYWLAARIGEAYVLPYRHLANDPNRKPPFTPDALVQSCIAAYRNANEPERIIPLLRENLDQAKNDKEANQARLVLAQEFEQNSRFKEALKMYQAVTDKNRWVSNKIAAMERRVK